MFGLRKKIKKESNDKNKPYLNLVPIVECLIQSGNYTREKSEYFVETRGGWVCYLRDPIDFELIRKSFHLPNNIEMHEENDVIADKLSWVDIKGGFGDRA